MATQYWCTTCNRAYPAERMAGGCCPQGHESVAPVGRFGGMIKSFIASGGIDERSEAQSRYRQLIHALWAQNERDQQFYHLLTPKISMGRFTKQMDDLHLRGIDEGWIRPIIPLSPNAPASDFRMEYDPPERFVIEVYTLFNIPVPDDTEERATALNALPIANTSAGSS